MKQAGILTFHHARSYGALLQTYALQQFLLECGISNEVVNYRCKFIEDWANPFRYVKDMALKPFLAAIFYSFRIRAFQEKISAFSDAFLLTSRPFTRETLGECVGDYEYFIAGSDQVWSPSCVGFDPVYFLDFAAPSQKYSYAASFGTPQLPEGKLPEYRNLLSDFQSISVREDSGRSLVRSLTGMDAQVHLDPTLLLTREQWDRIIPGTPRSPYILLFNVLKPVHLAEYALALSEKTGLPILWLNYRHKVRDKRITYIDSVSPNEFVELVKNAEYVCTNSFHGNAFSLIYHKQFIVETETAAGENSRSRELMQKLGLEARVLSTDHTPDILHSTDWSAVDRYFEQERERSRTYLLSIAEQGR